MKYWSRAGADVRMPAGIEQQVNAERGRARSWSYAGAALKSEARDVYVLSLSRFFSARMLGSPLMRILLVLARKFVFDMVY